MTKLVSLLLLNTLFYHRGIAQKNMEATIYVDRTERQYIIHFPPAYESTAILPLVLAFHGGSGTAKQMQGYLKLDTIADKENFIIVYPQGIKRQWNDGREFKEDISGNDDVKFISKLLDTLKSKYKVDSKRIFATGISNGGFFSLYLSYKLSKDFLAVAPVCATIPEKIYDDFYPAENVSILLINGTEDPLVPYNGGTVGNRATGNRGECTSTDQTIDRFRLVNQTSKNPEITYFPDKIKNDGCQVVRYTYANGKHDSKVILTKIINGGHTLPGGAPYLPKFIIGKVCRDINGNEMIWDFFKQCSPRG